MPLDRHAARARLPALNESPSEKEGKSILEVSKTPQLVHPQ